ncbi:protein DEEPER ROOTING 1-like isoform X1 [Primulina huaijiensis]|uniref:protein DEEPER ROOTING 1-like isoform X1 n=1 Tax=Primulina huaijiensis TaxID=1492673 RepID=UPI003CC73E65
MKIFSLLRKKGSHCQLNQESGMNNPMIHQSSREEFNDWPNALLAIGTFGNNSLKDSDKSNIQVSSSLPRSPDHLEHITQEDSRETDKELRIILNQHISTDSSFSGELEKYYASLEKFLEGLVNGDKIINKAKNSVPEKKISRFHQTSSSDHGREGNNVRLDKRDGIGKRSLSFLLKKAFLCRGGSVLTAGMRDPITGPVLANSRMDKILRAILNGRVYPQRSSPKAKPKKYLDMDEGDSDGEEPKEATDGSKWVKTDRECKHTTYFCEQYYEKYLHFFAT